MKAAYDISMLPSYADDDLAKIDPQALIETIVGDEDRAPRNLIDAAARRGDAMVAALARHFADRRREDDAGEWWLRLHAAMILGLIPGVHSGALLVDLLRRVVADEDDALQDWLAGAWPALFANKPAALVAPLRAFCADRDVDWYGRANALDAVVAAAQREGAAALDETMDWVAQLAADEDEDWSMRICCVNMLLDFPRPRHRALADGFSRRRRGPGDVSAEDVARAFARGTDEPDWRRFDDPWGFYTAEAIAQRQQRWAEEEAREDAGGDKRGEPHGEALDVPSLPYVRAMPRIGRNDPCPCGSGKKFKRCCGA
jgi:hypothetical protein